MFKGNNFIILPSGKHYEKSYDTPSINTTGAPCTHYKEQLFGQNGGLMNLSYSKANQMSEQRNIWKALKNTIEKTAVLTNKVILLTEGPFIFVR